MARKPTIAVTIGTLTLLVCLGAYNVVNSYNTNKRQTKIIIEDNKQEQQTKKFKVYYVTLGDKNKLISRDVEIDNYIPNNDNELIKQELLKLEKGGIKAAINTATKINTIAINQLDKIATVDLNHAYMDYMHNSGSNLESLTIQALVDTIGSFYNVEKVIITVNGKPYESGHIKLNEGEYFSVSNK